MFCTIPHDEDRVCMGYRLPGRPVACYRGTRRKGVTVESRSPNAAYEVDRAGNEAHILSRIMTAVFDYRELCTYSSSLDGEALKHKQYIDISTTFTIPSPSEGTRGPLG